MSAHTQVINAGPGDDPPWLATQFVPGPPLDEALARLGGPLPEETVWRLAAGLVEALRTVHASGMTHSDLKPQNVLLAPDGPRLVDFGISRALDGTIGTPHDTQVPVGTGGFTSSEQAAGQEALAAYLPDDSTEGYRAYGIMVLTLADGQVATITGFPDPQLFPVFGLPATP